MNWNRAILNNHNHPHKHHQQVPHPHPQVIFYLCLPTVLKLCTPAGLNLSLLATIHYSLVTFTFFRDFTLSWFLFCLSLLTFDFTSHFHFSIPMTKTLPTCHHSLLIIGNFHFSESLFTSDFTNQWCGQYFAMEQFFSRSPKLKFLNPQNRTDLQAFSSLIFSYTPNHFHLTAAALVVLGNITFYWKPVLSSEDLKWVSWRVWQRCW